MLDVYLLRHGQTRWNAEGNRYCGRTDIQLTEMGIRQAMAAREQLRGMAFAGVYSSPLQRAYDTARIVSGVENVIKDPRLIEVDFGKWEAKTREEFVAEDPVVWNNWDKDPLTTKAGVTGESGLEVIRRVDEFFTEALSKHKDSRILVVAHNGINRLYMAWKLGMEVRHYRRIAQENSSITMFTLENNGNFILKMLNSRGI